MTELFEEMAEMAEAEHVPSDEETDALRKTCVLLAAKQESLTNLEKAVKNLKEEIQKLSHNTLPDIMNEMGVDKFGLPEANCDLELKPFYRASIAAEWEESRRLEAFAYLEELGAGDLVRTVVSFSLGKTQLDLAKSVVAMIRMAAQYMEDVEVSEIPDPEIKMSVPWNTLTAFVKEQTESGRPIDKLETIGATVGEVVKIKERKK